MNIMRWEPLREFDDLFNRYSRLANHGALRSDNGEWTPTADISETDKEYLIKAVLPEVKRDDIKVTMDNGVITISGERKQEKEDKSESEIRVESFYGTFSRSFSLPENIDANHIRAESKDGVLRIHVPKTTATKPKAITVKVQ
ncbi:MAG: Hsp20/alpha crystallin family protein [Steroidobacteraceae bacterium]